MAQALWSFSLPWIVVGIVAVVAMSAAGPLVQARGFRGIAEALPEGDGPLTPAATRAIAERGPWVPLTAMHGAVLGLMWLMAMKPGWVGSVTALLLPAAAGWVVGLRLARRPGPTPGVSVPDDALRRPEAGAGRPAGH